MRVAVKIETDRRQDLALADDCGLLSQPGIRQPEMKLSRCGAS